MFGRTTTTRGVSCVTENHFLFDFLITRSCDGDPQVKESNDTLRERKDMRRRSPPHVLSSRHELLSLSWIWVSFAGERQRMPSKDAMQ